MVALRSAFVVLAPVLLVCACRVDEPHAPVSATTPANAAAPSSAPPAASAEASPVAVESASGVPRGAAAGPAELPHKCAAQSPVDAPCASFGGTYRLRLSARSSAKERCVVTKPVEATFTIDGSGVYKGRGQAPELEELGHALGLQKPELRIGAAVRQGVCCVDLILNDGKAVERTVRVHLARGDTKVSAKADERRLAGRAFCDAELDVEAFLAQ